MQTFDQSIFSLFQEDVITYEEALRWASNVDEFKLKVQGISTTSDVSRDQMATSLFGAQKGAAKGPVKDAAKDKAARPSAPPEITRFGK